VPEDSREFLLAWLAEEDKNPRKSPRAPKGTIAHGCEAFLTSATYRALNTAYSRVILAHANAIAQRYGKALLRDLEPRHIRTDLEPLTPAVASTRRKAWRKLAEFWAATGMTAGHFFAIAACTSASCSPRRRAYSASCCFVPPSAKRAGQKKMAPTVAMPLSLLAASSRRPPS
jgi:hypothetical protein